MRVLHALENASLEKVAEEVGRRLGDRISRETVRADLEALGIARRPAGRQRKYGPDVERACEQCGERFLARASEVAAGRGRFHSLSCLAAHGHATGRLHGRPNEKVTLPCSLCGESVTRSPSHVLTLVYCSRSCADADPARWDLVRERRQSPHEVACSECGTLFVRPPSGVKEHAFCSDECEVSYVKKHGLGGFRHLIDSPRVSGRVKRVWKNRWNGWRGGRPRTAEADSGYAIKREKVIAARRTSPKMSERALVRISGLPRRQVRAILTEL